MGYAGATWKTSLGMLKTSISIAACATSLRYNSRLPHGSLLIFQRQGFPFAYPPWNCFTLGHCNLHQNISIQFSLDIIVLFKVVVAILGKCFLV